MTWWADPVVLDWAKAAGPLLAAGVVYQGVRLTGKVTSRLAKKRLRHDRRQAALDRTYDDRARVFLRAQKMLRKIANESVMPYTQLSEDWQTKFSWSHAYAMIDRLTVYGPPESAALFQEAWSHHWEALACFSMVPAWYQAASSLDAGRWTETYEGRQGKKAEYDGSDHHARGAQVAGYFTSLCQANLADKDYAIPEERADVSSKQWREVIATHRPLEEIEQVARVDEV